MRTFADEPKAPQQATPVKPAIPGRAHAGHSHKVNSIVHLGRTIGNQAVQRLLQDPAEEFTTRSVIKSSTRFGQDNSRIQQHPPAAQSIQTKLAINRPGDEYEQQADRVADQVVRMPETQLQRDCACGGVCTKCQTEQPVQKNESLQTKGVGSIDSVPPAVPPIVHEVLSSAGEPLDAATRGFMERRFNYDFRQVRVHTGSKAAESARDLNANAYTVGPNIVFGAGQFLPGSQAGQHLLSHELTHVLQQQRSPISVARSFGVAGDLHERQAGAVADGLMRGGDISGLLNSGSGPSVPLLQRDTPQGTPAGQPPAAPPPPAQPLDYDRDPKNVGAVPPGQTIAGAKAILNDKIRSGEITRFAVIGVQPGSHAEIFLLSLLWGMAARARWGKESDIVTALDWPPKPGDPAPQGRVTVRIDHQGAASAELIAAGAVPAVAQTTFADGSAQLMADFGFTSVTGWPGQKPAKDAAEISDVLAALQLLKSHVPQDVPALRGVELIRVPVLPNQRAGEFFAGSQVALGAPAEIKPYLKLADLAFGSNTVQFFGGGPDSPTVPASFQIILHEVGHAVETEQLRLAREGYVKAFDEVEAARKLLEGDPAAYDAEFKAAKKKGQRAVNEFYKSKKATYDKNVKAQEEATRRQQEEANKLDATKVAGSGRTKRLQKFIDLVTANNIRKFTQYSATNWQNNPEEFYAEAYSLWLTDPAFVKTNYRVVFNFFQSGDYRT